MIVCALTNVASAVPHKVNFTARITDTGGQPATGPLTLKVTLFDSPTGGTMVWEETHVGVPVERGLVYASLGSVDAANALTPTVFDGRALYAELTVDGDVLAPRIPIDSVPYALRAEVADTLANFDAASTQKRVTGTCPTGNYITAIDANGGVSCATDSAGSGDITAVTAGGGLTGGGQSGAVSLSVDTSSIQARVTGTCATGSFITAIGQNGTVSCGSDQVGIGDISGVTAGAGLTGGGTTGSVSLAVDTSTIQSRVTGTCATGSFITAIAQNGSVTCGTEPNAGDITGVTAGTGMTGGGTSGTVTIGIAANGVTATEIANGAVTMAKTSGPIGFSTISAGPTSSINGSRTIYSSSTSFTPDSNGTCFLTAWAWADGQSNAPFFLEPALLNGNTDVFPTGSAWVPASSSAISGSYHATSSAAINVNSGTAYRAGCHLGTVGFSVANPACRVSWICN